MQNAGLDELQAGIKIAGRNIKNLKYADDIILMAESEEELKDFLMFKLVFEKAEEPEIKLPTSAGSWKKQENSRKTSISVLLTMPKPLTVWIAINWKLLKEMGIPDHLTCLLRNLYAGQEATELSMEQQVGSK